MHLPWRIKALAARAATFATIHPRDAMMFLTAFASLSIRGPEVSPLCFRAAVALASQPDSMSTPSALVEVLAALASLQARKIPLVNKVLLPRLLHLPESTDAKTLQRAVLAVLRLYRPGQSSVAVAVCDRLVGLCVRSYVHNPTDFALIAGAMALLPNTSAFVSPQGPDGRPRSPAVPLPTSFDPFSDLPQLQSVLAARNAGPLFFTEASTSSAPSSSWSDKPLLAAAWLVHQATACHMDEIRHASGNVVFQLLHMFLVLPHLREAIRNTLATHANGNHRALSHVRRALLDVDHDCVLFTTALGVTRCVPGGFASFVHAHLGRLPPSRATVPFLKRILAAMSCPVFAKALNSYDVAKLADAVLSVPPGQWRSIAKLRFVAPPSPPRTPEEADRHHHRRKVADESGSVGTESPVQKGKDVILDVMRQLAQHVQHFAHSSVQRRLPQDVVVSCAALRAVVHLALCIEGSPRAIEAAQVGSTGCHDVDVDAGNTFRAVWEPTILVLQRGFSRPHLWTTHNLLWAYITLAGVARRLSLYAVENGAACAAEARLQDRSLAEAIAGVARELSLRFSTPSASRDAITVQQCVQALHSTVSILCAARGRSAFLSGDVVHGDDHDRDGCSVDAEDSTDNGPCFDQRSTVDGENELETKDEEPAEFRSRERDCPACKPEAVPLLPLDDALTAEISTSMCLAILQHPSMEVVLRDFDILTPVDRASLQRSIANLYKCLETNDSDASQRETLATESIGDPTGASVERVRECLERFSIAFLDDCVARVTAAANVNSHDAAAVVSAASDGAQSAVDMFCFMCTFLDVHLCVTAAATLLRDALATLLLVSPAGPSTRTSRLHNTPDVAVRATNLLPAPKHPLSSSQLERLLSHMCRFQSALFIPDGEPFAAAAHQPAPGKQRKPTAIEPIQRPAATILRFDVQRLWHLHFRHAFFASHRSGESPYSHPSRIRDTSATARPSVSRYRAASLFCQSLQWLSNLGFSLHPGPIPADADLQVLKQRHRSVTSRSNAIPRRMVEVPVKSLTFGEGDEDVAADHQRSDTVGGGGLPLIIAPPLDATHLSTVGAAQGGDAASTSGSEEEAGLVDAFLRLSPAHIAHLTAIIIRNRHVQCLTTEFAVWCATLTGPLARSVPHFSMQAVVVLSSALSSEQLVRRCFPRIADGMALLHRTVELLADTQLDNTHATLEAEKRLLISDISWSPSKVLLIDEMLHCRVLDVLLAAKTKSATTLGDANAPAAGVTASQRCNLVRTFVNVCYALINDERVAEKQRTRLRLRLERWEAFLAAK